MKQQPLLSICIPTYNRDAIVYAGVIHALGFDSREIEVVVLDNHSQDKTEEMLLGIDDKRFRYYRNSENIGSANLLAVMRKASGKYLLLMSDEDEIVYASIRELINLIRNGENYALICGSVNMFGKPYVVRNDEILCKRYEAVRAIYLQTYMSGIVYNRDVLLQVIGEVPDTFVNQKFGAGYNFAIVATYMCEREKIRTTNSILCNHVREGKRDILTHFYLGKGKICCGPEARIECGCHCIKAFCSLNLSYYEKWELLMNSIFEQWLPASTVGYLNAAIKSGEEIKEALGMNELEELFPDIHNFDFTLVSKSIITELFSCFVKETNTSYLRLISTGVIHLTYTTCRIRAWWRCYKQCKQLLEEQTKEVKV